MHELEATHNFVFLAGQYKQLDDKGYYYAYR